MKLVAIMVPSGMYLAKYGRISFILHFGYP
jgi:hypothetical protein